jgi:hypothetical protein
MQATVEGDLSTMRGTGLRFLGKPMLAANSAAECP